MKKIKFISLLFVLTLLMGCGKAKLEDGKELVLELKGMKMTANDFYDDLKEEAGLATLVQNIDSYVLNNKYETTTSLKNEINSTIASYKEQYGDQYLEAINYYSGSNFTNDTQLFDYILANYKRELLISDYAKSIVTDEEIEKYYNEKAVGDMRAKHILITAVKTDDMTETEIADAEKEALNKAKDLITQLDNGADFEELAKSNSSDTGSASNGGDVGYFNRGKMVDEFEEATIALEVGKYTKTPVKTTYGYHIILKTEQLDKKTLEESKDSITNTIAQEKQETIANIYAFAIEAAMNEYELKIYDSGMKELYDNYMLNIKNKKE
ncbi:MAG: peptidylprolyl isomerase [Bacilli bacterium]|nr:peptidylprolyl isomerase [Bacilli bacterium]